MKELFKPNTSSSVTKDGIAAVNATVSDCDNLVNTTIASNDVEKTFSDGHVHPNLSLTADNTNHHEKVEDCNNNNNNNNNNGSSRRTSGGKQTNKQPYYIIQHCNCLTCMLSYHIVSDIASIDAPPDTTTATSILDFTVSNNEVSSRQRMLSSELTSQLQRQSQHIDNMKEEHKKHPKQRRSRKDEEITIAVEETSDPKV